MPSFSLTFIFSHQSAPKSDRYPPQIPIYFFPNFTLYNPHFSDLPNLSTNNSNSNSKTMGISSIDTEYTTTAPATKSHTKTRKVFLFTNYTLLAAASSCIFLTLSLRLIPSVCGFLLILLHLLTILGAISGCAAAAHGSLRWYGVHMVATVLSAIFQGSISLLIFTRSDDFLSKLKSYVREEDGVMILKLAGGLCAAIFFLEWLVLSLSFFLKYFAYVDGTDGRRTCSKVQGEENLANWPWPFQV